MRPDPLSLSKVKFELPGIVCVIFVQVLFPDAVNENGYDLWFKKTKELILSLENGN